MRTMNALWDWWIKQPERRSALISGIGLLATAAFIFWRGAKLTSTTSYLSDPVGNQALEVGLYLGDAIVAAAGAVLAWFGRRKRRVTRSWR
jgi:hypothetical protein